MAIMHERIKDLRNKKGYTLSKVADWLDVTEATAQRYETGKGIKTIPYEVIEKYANLFHCSPSYLMGWDEEEINAISQVQADANAYDDELESALISLTEQIKVSNLTLPQLTTLKTIVENIKILDLTEEELSEVYKYAQFLISRRS